MGFCQPDPKSPMSCPFSFGTLLIEISIICVAILSLVVQVKILKSPSYKLDCFPLTALCILVTGCGFQLGNTYFWYHFNYYYPWDSGINPPIWEIIAKAVCQVFSGSQYPVLVWLTVEYTSCTVILRYQLTRSQQTSSSMKRSQEDLKSLKALVQKEKYWRMAAWLQLVFYYATRLWYVIGSSECFYRQMSDLDRQQCQQRTQTLNGTTTVMICTSIAIWLAVNVYQIRRCIQSQIKDHQEGKKAQEQFNMNEKTLAVLITIISVQIGSTIMTLPDVLGTNFAYNALDVIVCLEYLSIAYLFWDMCYGAKREECTIIMDKFGNIIVIKKQEPLDDLRDSVSEAASSFSENIYAPLTRQSEIEAAAESRRLENEYFRSIDQMEMDGKETDRNSLDFGEIISREGETTDEDSVIQLRSSMSALGQLIKFQ